MEHHDYLKRRDELLAIRMDSFSSFDKAILSLATGSVALSVAFLDKIGKPFSGMSFTLILLVWICFFLVVLLNLASYLFARQNMDRKISELDDRYRKELETNTGDPSAETVYWQKQATSWCNALAFVTFAAGMLLFVIYVGIIQFKNYKELTNQTAKETTMAEKIQPLNKGKTEAPKAVSPKPPKSSGSAITHGATEAPQAILRPAKPSGNSPSGAKK